MNDGQTFLLYGREFKADPHPVYARLRERGPVHRVTFPSGVSGWLVTGYEAALQTLDDPRLGKNHALGNDAWRALAAIMPEPQHSLLQAHLLHQDPPKHTAMRRPVAAALAPRNVARRRGRIEQIAEELLDGLATSARAELVGEFAARFSFAVLSEMIGLPPALQREFRREWCQVVQPVGPRSPLRAAYVGRLEGLQAYVDRVVEEKRRRPGDDLLSELVAASDAGEYTPAELTSTVFQLLVAGQEPVTHQICMAVITLLSHRQQFDELREGAVDAARAVDELFRFDGSFELTTWRFFREPSVLHGVEIPAGDSIIVSLSAANRDPARFAEPNRLDLGRAPNPHLAFGHGIHFCPGAALGRVEVQVAVTALLRRFPALRLAAPLGEMEWVQAVLTRGVERLPVALSPD
ncbi:MAG TPA: cytochrome P450 [Polyangiaceae bacterium]|nr:cytochrome P450 [Polyangiaceae bacterium]